MKKVCIIEDNEKNLYLIKYLLEMSGFQVIYAMTGIDGIELATHDTPDMILLDIQLPEMSGYEVAQQLRKVGELVEKPIIAVTSYAMPGDKEKALQAGCTGYIEKPINPETFISEIRKFIPLDGMEGEDHE